jgi:hypothetical protein
VQQNREKKQTKIEQSGMTEAELIAAQEELFKTATNKRLGCIARCRKAFGIDEGHNEGDQGVCRYVLSMD